jgi:hypothetical protein
MFRIDLEWVYAATEWPQIQQLDEFNAAWREAMPWSKAICCCCAAENR